MPERKRKRLRIDAQEGPGVILFELVNVDIFNGTEQKTNYRQCL